MAENSRPSAQKGKKLTTATASESGSSASEPEPGETPEEALEIFERALHILEQAGVPVFLTPMRDRDEEYTGIIIKRTRLEGRHIKYTGNSTLKPA